MAWKPDWLNSWTLCGVWTITIGGMYLKEFQENGKGK